MMSTCAMPGEVISDACHLVEASSFEHMLAALPFGAMTCDLETFAIDYANPRAIALLDTLRGSLGFDPGEIIGTPIDAFLTATDDPRALLSDAEQLPHTVRIRFGEEWLDLHVQALPDSSGQVNRALLVWSVATAEVAREQEKNHLLRMIDHMPVAVMTVDPVTLRITYLNETSKRTLARIAGLLPVPATTVTDGAIDAFHTHLQDQRRLLSDPANLPHRATIRLGPEVLDLQVTAVRGADGSYLGPMLTWSVITQQIDAEARIQQLAHFDTLTGLANRNTFRERLDAALGRPDPRLGVLFIDLDGFKYVNDSNGHLVGDTLLRGVAERLRAHCSAADTLVGRLGGDEFAILIEGCDLGRAQAQAQTIIAEIVAPYPMASDRQLHIGASIGVAIAPEHGLDSETLLSRADMALYSAKAAGKKTFRVFASDLESRLYERVRLEGKLQQALTTMDGLFLFYQPILDIRTRRVTTREGLIRWYHPIRGWIPPSEFIPVAEESGLIEALGNWVLSRACRDAATWEDDARVAVNVSARQLGKGTLPRQVLNALIASGLAPDRLEIEITESVLLDDELDCLSDLRLIRELGVRVALDDFGTGFSSLAHLRSFPFDRIKIDGSFVRDSVKRPDCAAIVGVVADLGRRLGVSTVAEGVETQEHLDLVTDEGCSEVQGYLLGRPMPRDADRAAVAALDRHAADRRAAEGLSSRA